MNTLIVNPDSVTRISQEHDSEIVSSVISPSYKRRAVLRDVKTKRYVEVWNDNGIEASMDVTEAHGSFYTDDFISSLSFSSTEMSILYVAEGNLNASTDPYEKFRFKPQFGEGLSGKKSPTLFVFMWSESTGPAPAHQLIALSFSTSTLFGQSIFSQNGDTIYATGYEYTSDHRLLGIKGCYNRPSGIWEIKVPSSDSTDDLVSVNCSARKLTASNVSCRSPRILSHRGKHTLFWLSCPTGGPHAATSSLYALDITSPTTTEHIASPLVDTVFDPPRKGFPGLYPEYNLPVLPFLRPSDSSFPYLITQSIWGSRTTVIIISTSDGTVRDLTPEYGNLYSWKVLNTDGASQVICTRSTPTNPREVALGQLNSSGQITWRVIQQPSLPLDIKNALSSIRASIIPIPGRSPLETIVIQSKVIRIFGSIPPCITCPHGGPHSTTTTSFSPAHVALALQGYTISLPNYSGSLGFGETAVRSLLGKCGSLDVQDCISSTQHLVYLGMAVMGQGKQFLMGGSHGGFLSAHLIGQFPAFFTAAVIRNPVISVGEMASTDIPDWYYTEFGLEYSELPSPPSKQPLGFGTMGLRPPIMTPHSFLTLHIVSPIAHVHAVRAAVLLLIGAADLRVAPRQGIEYYHALKGRGSASPNLQPLGDVEMLVFEGESHPLDGVETSRVGWEAGVDFFARARRDAK